MSSPPPIAPATATSRFQTFRALSHPSFRRLWIASWLWYLSRMMEMVVLSWLVLELTDSPFQVALVGVSRMAPMFLLGLVAGSLADRFPKKRVMLTTQTLNLVVASAMVVLILSDVIQPWQAFLSTFLLGMAWTLDFSARRSFFSEMFEPTVLLNAVSLDVAALTGSSMIGPLLGGALIALVGFSGAYAVMVVFYVIGFFLLLPIAGGVGPGNAMAPGSVTSQVIEVVRTIRTNRVLWAALTVTVSLNFFGFPYLQMVPVIARDILGANEVLYGVLAASAGLGSLTGALVIASRTIRRQTTVYSLGAVLMLASIVLFALSSLYPLSLTLLFAAGIGMSGFATMQPAIAMQAVPPEMRGRAMGAVALGIGASPLGMLAVGQAAEALGPQAALALLAGAGFVVMNLLRLALPELRGHTR